MQTLPRVGAPPLRFKGAVLQTHVAGPLFVTLWQRKKGDFAVAYSFVDGGDILPHAYVAADRVEAADLLASVCADDDEDPPDLSNMPIGMLLHHLGHQQRFSHLVGTALAAWETAPSNTPQHPEE